MRSLLSSVVVAAIFLQPARGVAQTPDLKWGPAPAIFPAGAKFAVLQGDPSKAEPVTVRLDLPNGYIIAPHFHPTDEAVTVIEGTFLVGMGDKVEKSKTMALPVGGFVVAGVGQHHYGIAKGRTIVQVNLVGPFALTYVNPADDPTKKVAGKN
jgi:quercetin dioxygenase-like cupin family protein